MSRRRSRSSMFTRLRRWMGNKIESLGSWVEQPLRLLFLPLRLVNLFHDRGMDVNQKIRTRKGKSSRKWVNWLSAPIRLLAAPATLIRLAFKNKTQGTLVYFTPALLAVMLTFFVWYQVFFRSNRVQERYFLGARRAMTAGEVTLAKTYFQRLMDREALSAPQTLQWAFVLQRTGESNQAESLIASIAPDDEPGYPQAHAVRAIELAQAVELEFDANQEPPDAALLARLYFHLSNADNMDSRINVAWATYYQYQSDLERAIEYLEEVAERLPKFYITIANLAEENGLPDVADNALQNARTRYQVALTSNPADHDSRVMLANVLVRMDSVAEARRVLEEGLRFQDHPNLRRGLADLFVVMYIDEVDRMMESGDTSITVIARQFQLLKQAMITDSTYTLPHVRMVDWFLLAAGQPSASYDETRVASRPPTFNLEKVGEVLTLLITSNSPQALDHAAYGFLNHLKKDASSSQWHLKQAFIMDSGFGNLGRHQAVAVAFRDQHAQLTWALDIAKRAHEQLPENADIQQAYGMVLLQADQTEEGIRMLEASLEKATFPGEIHQALGTAYSNIGRPMKAVFHAQQAEAVKARDFLSQL